MFKKLILITSLFIVSSSIVFTQVSDDIENGNEAFENGNYEAAIIYYTKSINKGERNGKPLYWRAVSNMYSGNTKEAISDLKQYLELEKNDSDAYNMLGLLYYETGDPSEAVFYYTKAIEVDSDFEEALLNRAMGYSALSGYDLAKDDFAKVLEINPVNEYAHRKIAEMYYGTKDWKKARHHARQSINLGSASALPYYILGNLEFKNKKYSKAINYYLSGREIDKTDINILNNLAVAYDEKGDDEKANIVRKEIELITGIPMPELSTVQFDIYKDAQDAFIMQFPLLWDTKTSRIKPGLIKITSVPSNYKENHDSSPVGMTLLYYYDLEQNFGKKDIKKIISEYENAIMQANNNYFKYIIVQRQVKKYGGIPFSIIRSLNQPLPNDNPVLMDNLVADIGNNMIMGNMRAPERFWPYFDNIFTYSLSTLDLSSNKYLNN
ncbi:MAG: hypothetical protein Kapaf2KO_16800 [Candidatus Kapaibacteriales bacterium]